MRLPTLLPNGYLPPGIHQAPLDEITAHFGSATPRRQVLASRLHELLTLARATGPLYAVWGG